MLTNYRLFIFVNVILRCLFLGSQLIVRTQPKHQCFKKNFKVTGYFLYLSSDKIYYCTHDDNLRPDQFSTFCKTFLEDHAERTSSGEGKDKIVLVLSIPTENRLDPYEYFKERVKKLVTTCRLNVSGKGNYFIISLNQELHYKLNYIIFCYINQLLWSLRVGRWSYTNNRILFFNNHNYKSLIYYLKITVILYQKLWNFD